MFPRALENVPNAADVLGGILAPAGWDARCVARTGNAPTARRACSDEIAHKHFLSAPRHHTRPLQDLGHVGGRVGVPGQIGIYPLPTYPSGVLDTTPYPLPTYPQFAAR